MSRKAAERRASPSAFVEAQLWVITRGREYKPRFSASRAVVVVSGGGVSVSPIAAADHPVPPQRAAAGAGARRGQQLRERERDREREREREPQHPMACLLHHAACADALFARTSCEALFIIDYSPLAHDMATELASPYPGRVAKPVGRLLQKLNVTGAVLAADGADVAVLLKMLPLVGDDAIRAAVARHPHEIPPGGVRALVAASGGAVTKRPIDVVCAAGAVNDARVDLEAALPGATFVERRTGDGGSGGGGAGGTGAAAALGTLLSDRVAAVEGEDGVHGPPDWLTQDAPVFYSRVAFVHDATSKQIVQQVEGVTKEVEAARATHPTQAAAELEGPAVENVTAGVETGAAAAVAAASAAQNMLAAMGAAAVDRAAAVAAVVEGTAAAVAATAKEAAVSAHGAAAKQTMAATGFGPGASSEGVAPGAGAAAAAALTGAVPAAAPSPLPVLPQAAAAAAAATPGAPVIYMAKRPFHPGRLATLLRSYFTLTTVPVCEQENSNEGGLDGRGTDGAGASRIGDGGSRIGDRADSVTAAGGSRIGDRADSVTAAADAAARAAAAAVVVAEAMAARLNNSLGASSSDLTLLAASVVVTSSSAAAAAAATAAAAAAHLLLRLLSSPSLPFQPLAPVITGTPNAAASGPFMHVRSSAGVVWIASRPSLCGVWTQPSPDRPGAINVTCAGDWDRDMSAICALAHAAPAVSATAGALAAPASPGTFVGERRQELVFEGADGMDHARLRAALDECLLTEEEITSAATMLPATTPAGTAVELVTDSRGLCFAPWPEQVLHLAMLGVQMQGRGSATLAMAARNRFRWSGGRGRVLGSVPVSLPYIMTEAPEQNRTGFGAIRQGKVRVAQTACGVVKAERLRGLRRSTRRYVRNVTLNQARLRYAVVRRSCVGRASISARERAIHRQKKQECLGGFREKHHCNYFWTS
jgi:hypothetical protein